MLFANSISVEYLLVGGEIQELKKTETTNNKWTNENKRENWISKFQKFQQFNWNNNNNWILQLFYSRENRRIGSNNSKN